MRNEFELFKNRLVNGKPFLKKDATEVANNMRNNFEVTVEQFDELMAIIEANGKDVLDDDAMARLSIVEKKLDDTIVMMGDMIGGAI